MAILEAFAARERTLFPGAQVAGYRIDELVRIGGMGVVYRATQLTLDRTVALKVIKPEYSEDGYFRRRFVLESRLAASIEHPNVIPIYEADDANGLLYIAMRYVDGISLSALQRGGVALEPAHAVWILSQVAAGLDAAHAGELVHRDVKPANVLMTGPEGQEHVYLTDFGRVEQNTSPGGLIPTGQWVGTLDYVAPEQLRGDPLDARADVYSLGCLLYRALAGHVPYPRDSDQSKIRAIVNDPPPSLPETAPSVPEEFNEVVKRALAKDPPERFSSAGDLSRSAVAALDGRPVA